jgi:K(+)-stimulated pyrophosphate-energized sodium pump
VPLLPAAGIMGASAAAGGHAAAAVATTAAPAATASAAADGPSFKVENGVVKFYFASGKADLATGANAALADVAKGVAGGKKAVVSGYTDSTGDAAKNEELAKQRAMAVSAALKAAGIADDKIELKKPEVLTGSGTNADARRVEVALQ